MDGHGPVQQVAWAGLVAIASTLLVANCLQDPGADAVFGPGLGAFEDGTQSRTIDAPDPAIAFVTYEGRHVSSLKVMDADGSNRATVFSAPDDIQMLPSWSPDGRSIAFHHDGTPASCGWNLARIDVEVVDGVPTGANFEILLERNNSITEVAWSPLGTEIAFVDLESRALEVVPASGGDAVVVYVSPPGLLPHYPAWSRDGTLIAFVEWEPAAAAYAIRAVNTTTGRLSTLLGAAFSRQMQQPGYSGLIRFLDWGHTWDCLTFDVIGRGEIYVLEVPGGTPRLVARGNFPTWSPDDSEILFSGGHGRLSKVDPKTGAVTEVGGDGNWPDWRAHRMAPSS